MLKTTILLFGCGACQLSKIETKRLQELATSELRDSKFLDNMVNAGLILENLALLDEPTMQSGCRTYQSNIAVHLVESQMSVRDVFHQAEISRLFKCEQLKASVKKNVSRVLESEIAIDLVDDFYFAYQLWQHSKSYGVVARTVSNSEDAYEKLLMSGKKDFLNESFDAQSWTFKETPFNVQTLHFTEVIASTLTSNKKYRSQIESKMHAALESLTRSAFYDGSSQQFFLPQNYRLAAVELNYFIFSTVQAYNKQAPQLLTAKLNPLKLRKYFHTKAALTNDLSEASFALKGLKALAQITPFIVKTANKSKFRFVDHNNNDVLLAPMETQSYLVSATQGLNMPAYNSEQKIKAAITDGILQVELAKSLKPGRYWIEVRASVKEWPELVIRSVELVTVSSNNQFTTATYQLEGSATTQPSDIEFGDKFKLPSATDNSRLHLTLAPNDFSYVYLSLRKTDYMPGSQVPITAYADIQNQITFDFKRMDLINGSFEIKLVGVSAGQEPVVWDLGSVNVWFKEGNSKATNDGATPQYASLPEFTSQFDPKTPEKSPLIPMLICAALLGCLVYFLTSICAQGANAKLMGATGFLFLLNILCLMALLVAFWVGICNLLELMWILLFSLPLSLFLLNRGLAPENSCSEVQ